VVAVLLGEDGVPTLRDLHIAASRTESPAQVPADLDCAQANLQRLHHEDVDSLDGRG
jgi:hypothetical protein